jgi:hypothetical protein
VQRGGRKGSSCRAIGKDEKKKGKKKGGEKRKKEDQPRERNEEWDDANSL